MSLSFIRLLAASTILVCAACDGSTAFSTAITAGAQRSAVVANGGRAAESRHTMRVGESLTLELGVGLRRNRSIEWTSSSTTVAAVNASGTVRAFAVGTAIITAQSGGVVEQRFPVVVEPELPQAVVTVLSLEPSTVTALTPGERRQYTVTPHWSDGVYRPVGVTYSASGGSITSDGLFTAGTVAGTFTIVAHCLCGLIASRPVEIISDTAQLQKLTISPKTVTLTPEESQQFTVKANWATGATELPAVTWSANGGSVSPTGRYTAPAEEGTYIVVVSHSGGSQKDTATVIVALGVNRPPTSEPSPSPFFSDGFETGSYASANGFHWESPVRVSVSSERAFSGRYALRFSYPGVAKGEDGWSEQRFDMGRYTPEVWIEYMVYVPTNYRHRNERGNNNKFIVLWKDTYGSLSGEWQISWEYTRRNDGSSFGRFMSSRWDQPYVTDLVSGTYPGPRESIELIGGAGPMKIGQWNRVRFMAKAATSRTSENGESRLWVNETLVLRYTAGRFYGSDPSKGNATLRRGYLFGWSNSGFDEETVFYVDEIKFYTRNPGW